MTMTGFPHHPRARAQRGAVLLVGIVMLLMVLIVTMGVIRLTMRHTQVVSNEQVRTEAEAAADYALDSVLNTPASTWDDQFKGAGTALTANLGTSSTTDAPESTVSVTVSNLTCKRTRIIKNSELIKKSGGLAYVAPSDTSCFGGGGSPITIVDSDSAGTSAGNSLCATVMYELQAQPNDPKLLGASPTVVQGVEVRRSVDILSDCD
jgi:Tfp pilus assembly protein PilX